MNNLVYSVKRPKKSLAFHCAARETKRGNPERMAGKQKSGKKKTTEGASNKRASAVAGSSKTRLQGILRGFFLFCLAGVFILGVAAFFVERSISRHLRSQALESFASIASRAFCLEPEHSVDGVKLFARLERLGYRSLEGSESKTPLSAGEYRRAADQIELYTRGIGEGPDAVQRARNVRILLLNGGKVAKILERSSGTQLARVCLEPENIAALGEGAKRISSARELERFPPSLVQALLSIEDRRFFSHFGVDPFAIARALLANIDKGRVVQEAQLSPSSWRRISGSAGSERFSER